MIRKDAFFILFLVLVSTVCLAGRATGVANKEAPARGMQKPAKVMEISGKVDAVILRDPVNEIRPKIIIITADGIKHTFVVQPTTTMYYAEWHPAALDKIIRGQSVSIKYELNKNGYKIALTIEPSRTGTANPSIPRKGSEEKDPRE
jgi:hypothetical protein